MTQVFTVGVSRFINFGLSVSKMDLRKRPSGERVVAVLNSAEDIELARRFTQSLRESDIILINSDIRELYECAKGRRFLTYGFGRGACVSASSIVSSDFGTTVQVCVMRAFRNLSGQKVIEQEFPVTASQEIQVSDILASISTFLLCN
ncbi:hypothetical protein AGMMS49975_02940 [Clostridia bacterium]|nr:hypothetical protein AGMMS49975_02940 [Clostridia bacterium]